MLNSAKENPPAAQTPIRVYALGERISFSWTRIKNAARYRYQIVDLATHESVKIALTKSTQGHLSSEKNTKIASYQLVVTALRPDDTLLARWQQLFNTGAAIPPPQNMALSPEIAFDPKGQLPAPSDVQTFQPKRENLPHNRPPFSHAKNEKHSMPADCTRNHLLFMTENSNAEKHWVNGTLSDSFWGDVARLISEDQVGYLRCETQLEYETFALLNEYRRSHALRFLAWNDNLMRMARLRALGHIAEPGYSHDMTEIGGSLVGSLTRWGLHVNTGVRENIAWMSNNFGKSYSAKEIMAEWIRSPSHEGNLLRDALYVGIGIVCKKTTVMTEAGPVAAQGIEAVMLSVQ